MRIGIDFDNTIACYDGVFHAAALARGLIPASLGADKNAVRDYLNGVGRKDAFTELQGYVYGARMDLVSPYPEVKEFIAAARAAGHEPFVISHKTRRPMLGPAYDMHEAARGFLRMRGLVSEALIPDSRVFFEETKEEKLARARHLSVDVFIDDLPEILAHPQFPANTRALLFDPLGQYPGGEWKGFVFESRASWASLRDAVLG